MESFSIYELGALYSLLTIFCMFKYYYGRILVLLFNDMTFVSLISFVDMFFCWYWTPVFKFCPNYEVVEFQLRKFITLDIGSVAYCHVYLLDPPHPLLFLIYIGICYIDFSHVCCVFFYEPSVPVFIIYIYDLKCSVIKFLYVWLFQFWFLFLQMEIFPPLSL